MFMKISEIFKEWILDIKMTKKFHIYIFNTKKIFVQYDFFFCNANLYNITHIYNIMYLPHYKKIYYIL